VEQFTDVDTAIAAIKAHAACAEFVDNVPGKYIVYYPFPGKMPGGAITNRKGDDLVALNLLYAKIDQFWQSLGK
jgi:hypothetical protein